MIHLWLASDAKLGWISTLQISLPDAVAAQMFSKRRISFVVVVVLINKYAFNYFHELGE